MTNNTDINNIAIREMIKALPQTVSSFKGSQYPLPINAAFLGDEVIDTADLKESLQALRESDVKNLLEPILLGAELIEASHPDKDEFFITDGKVRDYVFGSKWNAGWVLVLGGDNGDGLLVKLKEKGFLVFTDRTGVPDTCFIGDRATSPVYFLQMMVRYGLVWGRIAPGDDHEMGHFLERDMPGFMIIAEELVPLKYLVALGIMKLGAPALVPSSFPFPYGTRIVTDNPVQLVETGVYFRNLRMRYYNNEVISLPDCCNPAFANEKIEGGTVYGKGSSFFCLKAREGATPGIHTSGSLKGQMGILVEVDEKALTFDLTQIVEQTAIRSINYLPGIKAYEKDSMFYLQLSPGVEFDSTRLGEVIRAGIRLQYPRLEKISISMIFDEDRVEEAAPEITAYKAERRKMISAMTEENTEEFCACIECRPFSLEHTCILTPDRIPMCASRTYFSVKAESLLGSNIVPYKRQSEKKLPLKLVFEKGRALDGGRGEYEGCNRIYGELTEGRLNKVYLHSLRDFPHTSCGCFQNLAFWMEDVKGIGIMSRGSKAVAPDGRTWDALANYAGGKQSNGIMGVSVSYIRSQSFLKGDGGIGKVVWADSELYGKISGCFKDGQRVATEKDAASIDELKKFCGIDVV